MRSNLRQKLSEIKADINLVKEEHSLTTSFINEMKDGNFLYWRDTIVETTKSDGREGMSPIVEIRGGPQAGYFSVALLSLMMDLLEQRYGSILTHVFLSTTCKSDMREWIHAFHLTDQVQIELMKNEDSFFSRLIKEGFVDRIFGVNLIPVRCLGTLGEYNIHSNDSCNVMFHVNKHGQFGNYSPCNTNKIDSYGQLVYPGETQIYGFDLSYSPDIKNPHDFIKEGRVVMGLIDRSL